jgi:YD repeat-containing protein
MKKKNKFQMGKWLLFLLVITVFMLSGCSKSTELNDPVSIVGSWRVVLMRWIITSTGETISEDEYDGNSSTMTFDENGTGLITDSGEQILFTYSLDSNLLSVTWDDGSSVVWTYSINDADTELTLQRDENDEDMTSELVLERL